MAATNEFKSFRCIDCDQDKPIQTDGGTGYATLPNGDRVCYGCIANRDRVTMIKLGHGNHLPLYLSRKSIHKRNDGTWKVGNWPDTLSFPIQRITEGRHNIAGKRYDVWFYGPDGHIWHGVQFGEMTQIIHCRRTRERVAAWR
jgi:hypothetical protein